ncbi:MAG: hypothetical protein CMH13_18720 [Martelella sp.]|nr:hypothetical protein [Martelella sp.]
MSGLDAGYVYDYSKLDRHYQTSEGANLADEDGESVGLSLDSRRWAGLDLAEVQAGQSELVTNGTFASDLAGWVNDNNYWTWVSGKAFHASGDVFNTFRTDACGGQSGNRAILEFDVSGYAGASGLRVQYRTASNTPLTGGLWGAGSERPSIAANGRHRSVTKVPAGAAYIAYARDITSSSMTVAIDNVTFRVIPGLEAAQATTNFRPARQANGVKFDGSDDRLVSLYGLSGAGDVFAFDHADIPAVVPATQILFGAQDGSGNGAYLGITSAGALRVKIGQAVIDSSGVDLRGGRHVIGFYTVGSTVYLYADGTIVGSDAWTGSLPATPWHLGAVNANGTASAFFGGSLFCPLSGRATLTLDLANQIRNALLSKG